MTTMQQKPAEVKRAWHLIDVKGRILGDASVEIANKLMGKSKVTFTPHVDGGDYVIVINAQDVDVTGKKRTDKMYYSHSMIPGGFKEVSFEMQMSKDPTKIIQHAVKGMLPKNKMRDVRMTRLKIFTGNEHPYQDKIKVK